MFCSKCGKNLPPDAIFCPVCGTAKATDSAAPSRKDQIVEDMKLSGIAARSATEKEVDRGGRIFLGVLGVGLVAAVGWGLMNGGYDAGGFLRMITGSGTPTKSASPLLTGETQSYEVVVTGIAPSSSGGSKEVGIPFHGSYMTMAPGGSSSSQSVEGVTPQSYSTSGVLVSTTFQMKGTYEATLRVEIKVNGSVKKSAQTSAAYGVVSVATD